MIREYMEKLIALLPMKGHSERVPNKNLKLFNGRPLYHTILGKLLKSKNIEKIAINTDSDEIKQDVKSNFGETDIVLIDRPKEIQGDYVSMNDVIAYDLSQLKEYEHFIQTHSTNPLLKTETIDKAIEKYFHGLNSGEFDSVFSVTRYQTRFYWKNGQPINHDPNKLIRTQDLPIMYEENSNFYIFNRKSFRKSGKKRIGIKPYMLEVDELEGTDIDDNDDFILAEKLL